MNKPPMTDDIRTLLEIGREAYSDVYVFAHGEDDNHYDALDAAIMAVLAAAPARPSRGVVDEDVVIQAERAFWPAYNEALRVHGTKADCHAIGMRAALQAAALPAAPEDTEWREAFVEVSASRYRDAGMKIEAARIHAEVDANQLETIWRAKKAATEGEG